jgi:excisionase family DNA binding protein
MEVTEARVSMPDYNVSELKEGTTLSVLQAATFVGVSRRSIYLWMKTGRLPIAGRTPGGSVRIYREDLLRVK